MSDSAKTILITGSSKGLGAHMAIYFAKKGFNVVVTYSKSKQDIEKLKKKFPKQNQPLILKGDVTKLKDASYVVKATKNHFGTIDVLINNAGIHMDSPISRMSSKIWKKVLLIFQSGVAHLPQPKDVQY